MGQRSAALVGILAIACFGLRAPAQSANDLGLGYLAYAPPPDLTFGIALDEEQREAELTGFQQLDLELVDGQVGSDHEGIASSASPAGWKSPWLRGWGQFVPRAGIGYEAGRGIGYGEGYGNVQALLPLVENPGRALVFSDLRFLVDNDLRPGNNLGLGYRGYAAALDRVFGVALYYDQRETDLKTFRQLTVSLDTLGQWWDLRANAYFPSIFSDQAAAPPYFAGNSLVLGDEQRALTGVDMEVLFALPAWRLVEPRVGAGGYWFRGPDVAQIWGWKLSAEARVGERVVVDAGLHDDRQFGTTVNLGVTWYFPSIGSQRRGTIGCRSVAERLGEPIRRQELLAVSTMPREVARDPDTGSQLAFLHVGPPQGTSDGSFESPYASLAEALGDTRCQNGDVQVVYVRSDPASPLVHTGDLAMVSGIQLRSNGPRQHIPTQRGAARLPFSGAASDLAGLPQISGNALLASHSYLSGFDVRGGIAGHDVSDVTIAENHLAVASTVQPTQAAGTASPRIYPGTIALDHASGSVTIRGNLLHSGENLANVAPTPYAIALRETQGATVTIADNTVEEYPTGILLSGGTMTARITDNDLRVRTTTFSNASTGISLKSNLTFIGDIRGNKIVGNPVAYGYPQYMPIWHSDEAFSAEIRLGPYVQFTGEIADNTMRGSDFGILMEQSSWLFASLLEPIGPPPHGGAFHGTVANNRIQDHACDGICLHKTDFVGSIRNNTISTSQSFGIRGDFDQGRCDGEIAGNTLGNNGQGGIGVTFITRGINQHLAVLDNQFSRNGIARPSFASDGAIFDLLVVHLSSSCDLYLEIADNRSLDAPLPGSERNNYEVCGTPWPNGGQVFLHQGKNTGTLGVWFDNVRALPWTDWPNWPH